MRVYVDEYDRIDSAARWIATPLITLILGPVLLRFALGPEWISRLSESLTLIIISVIGAVALVTLIYFVSRTILRSLNAVLARTFAKGEIARHYPRLVEQLLSGEGVRSRSLRGTSVSESIALRRTRAVGRWGILGGLRQHVTLLRQRASPAQSPLRATLRSLTDRWISPHAFGPPQAISTLAYADPIYGTIHFSSQFSPLVRHPILQRLQEIRQLTFAFVAYPGATHTRFSHSLGVAHLAGMALRGVLGRNTIYRDDGQGEISLSESERERLIQLATVAGLVHDAAHGPLGHALDRFFGTKFLEGLPSADKGFLPRVLRDHLSLAVEAVGDVSVEDVIQVLNGEEELSGWDNFLSQLLDSGLDVDRIDYLQRDAHFTGHREGLLDIDALLNAIRPFEREGRIYLAFDSDAINHIEQFVYARDAMYLRCYEHPAKTVSEWLAIRAVKELFQDNPFLASEETLYEFVLLSDNQLLELLSLATPAECLPRSLLQELFRGEGVNFREVTSVPFEDRALTDRLQNLMGTFLFKSGTVLDRTEELESAIAQMAGVDAKDLVLMCPLPNAVDERDTKIGILRKEQHGYRRVPIFGDGEHEAPSELFRRLMVVGYEAVQAATTLEEARSLEAMGITFMGMLRKARAKLRLFLHTRAWSAESRVREAFYTLGVRSEYRH